MPPRGARRVRFQKGEFVRRPRALHALCVGTLSAPAQDIANQIKHWTVYTEKMKELGTDPGHFLRPEAAEWFSGQPALFVAYAYLSFAIFKKDADGAGCQDCRLAGLTLSPEFLVIWSGRASRHAWRVSRAFSLEIAESAQMSVFALFCSGDRHGPLPVVVHRSGWLGTGHAHAQLPCLICCSIV